MAQSPEQFSYQAALHDQGGCPLVDANVSLQIVITEGSLNGTLVYEEEHFAQTDAFGIVQLQIGAGQVSGASPNASLGELFWGTQSHFLNLTMDVGDGIVPVGGMQLLSVPYALHASTAATALTVENVDDADADPSNELITALQLVGTELSVAEGMGGAPIAVDLASLVNDADADPANELIASIELNGTELTLAEGLAGTPFTTDLSSLIDDADANPANELISELALDGTMLNITEAGATASVDLTSLVDDADANPANEIINLAFINPNDELVIQQAGGNPTINVGLSSIASQWEENDDAIYHEEKRVGIALDNPTSTLHIAGSISYEFRTISDLNQDLTVTLDENDHIMLCDNQTNDVTLVLPLAATVQGRVYRIKTFGNGGALNGQTTLQGSTFNLIEGQQSLVLNAFVSESVDVLSNGIQWFIISRN